MPGKLQRDILHVEGKNDVHVIRHLLLRHHIELQEKTGPIEFRTPKQLSGSESEGVESLLQQFTIAVEQASGTRIGFVLDADQKFDRRWKQITARLHNLGVEAPVTPPKSGLVAFVEKSQTTVGVWLMPDNQQSGTLEDFLRRLIHSRNRLIEHAEAATDEARQNGARYRSVDRLKAVLHTWLAWQQRPGLPYGAAVNAHYFGHRGKTASAFVAWFKRLYGIT